MKNEQNAQKTPSPFAYRSFVGRTLVQQKTGEVFHITGYVGTHQFIVRQEGVDVDMFIPIKKLHHYVMMPIIYRHDDERACANTESMM